MMYNMFISENVIIYKISKLLYSKILVYLECSAIIILKCDVIRSID